MSLPDVVSREQWLEARRRLLAQEKEHTRSRDALNADRRRRPMVGTEYLGNTYTLLDLTALGRQEDWEEPKGRVDPVRGGDPTFTS